MRRYSHNKYRKYKHVQQILGEESATDDSEYSWNSQRMFRDFPENTPSTSRGFWYTSTPRNPLAIRNFPPASETQTSRHKRKMRIPKRKAHVPEEIIRLRQSTKMQIAKLPFSRLIRELLMHQASGMNMRITLPALVALQESAELYLTQLFEDAYRCTLHRNRVTLVVKDLELVRHLRGPNDPGSAV